MRLMRRLLRVTAAVALPILLSSCGIRGDLTHMSAKDRSLINQATSCARLRSLAAGWQVDPGSNDGQRERLNDTLKREQQLKCGPPAADA